MSKLTDRKVHFILFFLAFIVYANTLRHDYAWDDSIVITDNHRIKKGISGIPDLFVKYNSDYKSDKYGYRPIVLASFAVDYSLAKLNPHFGHFMNVLYFALLCLVMFKVLRSVFDQLSNLAPFLITVLFIVHPIHVEVVANIKSRDEIFALLFALLSLSAFLKYFHSGHAKNLLFSILLFLFAFLSKESAITILPIFLLAIIYQSKKLDYKKLILPSVSILFLILICLGIYKIYTGSSLGKDQSAGAGIYYESGLLGNSFFYIDRLMMKLPNAFTVLFLYLKNFFFPITQLYYYGFNQVPVAQWNQPLVLLSLFVHLALLAFAIIKFKQHKEMAFGILFYLIGISIYTHLFRTLADTMADRFLFSPSIGLSIFSVFVIGHILKIDYKKTNVESLIKISTVPRGASGSNVKALSRLRTLFLIVFLLLGIKTFTRNRAWKDNWTLISTDMPRLENCARAHNYYADQLKTKLQSKFDPNLEKEMIFHFKKSIEISKASYYAYMGLGTYYCDNKRYLEGISVLDSMVKLFPNQADPNFFLGRALFETNSYSNAIYHLEKSLQLAPAVFETYYFLCLTYSKNGDYEKAFATIKLANEKFPNNPGNTEALSNIYYDQGDLENSTKALLDLYRLGGDGKRIYGTIIGRYQLKKQDSLAAKYYKEALAKGIFKR